MKIRVELHIPPGEVRNKTCFNCLNSKMQIHRSKNREYISALCLVSQDILPIDGKMDHCTAYSAIHWETIRVNDYRKLNETKI